MISLSSVTTKGNSASRISLLSAQSILSDAQSLFLEGSDATARNSQKRIAERARWGWQGTVQRQDLQRPLHQKVAASTVLVAFKRLSLRPAHLTSVRARSWAGRTR